MLKARVFQILERHSGFKPLVSKYDSTINPHPYNPVFRFNAYNLGVREGKMSDENAW